MHILYTFRHTFDTCWDETIIERLRFSIVLIKFSESIEKNAKHTVSKIQNFLVLS